MKNVTLSKRETEVIAKFKDETTILQAGYIDFLEKKIASEQELRKKQRAMFCDTIDKMYSDVRVLYSTLRQGSSAFQEELRELGLCVNSNNCAECNKCGGTIQGNEMSDKEN